MPLASVQGDIESHGNGALNNSQNDVLINNKPIIVMNDSAAPDSLCSPYGGNHCSPNVVQASDNVYVHNKAVHRFSDLRSCGASTIVINQTSVFVNGGGGPTSITMTPESPVDITPIQANNYQLNVNNTQQYNTITNIENGVDNHPEMPDDPTVPVTQTINPNCSGGGDMGVALDKVLLEANQGSWKENGHNPNIEGLYANVGFPNITSDRTAWCAAFTGSLLKDNCFKYNKSLAAGSYTNYGNPINISQAQKGDIIVFNRDGGTGHVALYYGPGPTPGTIYVVGGNQSDNVTKSLRKVSDIKSNGVQRPIPA
jgi:uncharacterized protein (TIGR02594 family)